MFVFLSLLDPAVLHFWLNFFFCSNCSGLLYDDLNFEVSTGAFGILEQAATSENAVQRMRMQLQKYVPSVPVAEHQEMAHEALFVLTAAAPK